jgi:hypothetical protein
MGKDLPLVISGVSICSRDEFTALLIKKSRPCPGATTARPETPGTFRRMRVAPEDAGTGVDLEQQGQAASCYRNLYLGHPEYRQT